MANPRKVEMDTEVVETQVAQGSADELVSDANATICDDVRAKIKSRFLPMDTVNGRAQMFDTATHAPGIDYTAGGLLKTRWVNANEANIHAKRMKGYVMPSEVSSLMKNLNMGNMTLMVRSAPADKAHTDDVEKLNKSWEAKARAKTSPKAGEGLGEFEVTPQRAARE